MSTLTMSQQPIVADAVTEKPRIASIDIVRGLVMVIMALDHVRDFFHFGAIGQDPTNMTTTTPALFFTRFITHYCAPTFVFLAGTSIFILSQRKSHKEMSLFLLSRGAWLLVLEVVVVRFAIIFNFYYDVIFFQVIWAIGASMICMAALTYLKPSVILALGLIIVAGHNLTDLTRLTPGDNFYAAWTILRQSGFVPINENTAIFVIYPLLPWLGIMMLGYCFGQLYSKGFDALRRRKILTTIGLCAIGLFIILRSGNFYGDPAPWSTQKDSVYTLLSFINVTKYPVSLQYALITLGPMLLLLAAMEKVDATRLKPLLVFGRVPMFYYILHFALAHLLGLLFYMNKTGKSFSDLDFHFNQSFGGLTAEAGYSLPWVYVAWALIVLSLYPVCKWYYHYKSAHSHWWLSYM